MNANELQGLDAQQVYAKVKDTFDDKEIGRLLVGIEESVAIAVIDKFPMSRYAMVKTNYQAAKGTMRVPDLPSIPGVDTIATGLGIGAGVSAVAAARLAELVKGSSTTYNAVLSSGELRGRLRTVLGEKFLLTSNDPFVSVTRNGESFCQIRLAVSESEKRTAVTISGLNLDQVKQGANGVVDGLLSLGKKAVQGHGLVEGAFDVAADAIDTAKQAGSDLMTANTIADTIEKYGADAEQAIEKAARKAAVEKAEDEAREQKKKHCSYCSTARTLGEPCPNCGAVETD